MMQFFPYVVAVVEIAAAGVYSYHHEWRLMLVWFFVGLANLAMAGIR